MLRLLTAFFALGLVGCATVEEVEPEPIHIYCIDMPDGVALCTEESALLVV